MSRVHSVYIEYTHLGHVISANLDDKDDIINKRNSLCGKINSVLCYFCEDDALVKLKLLRLYCSDFYGSVLWDLSHSSVEDVCIAWCRGLRRAWGLSPRTHYYYYYYYYYRIYIVHKFKRARVRGAGV